MHPFSWPRLKTEPRLDIMHRNLASRLRPMQKVTLVVCYKLLVERETKETNGNRLKRHTTVKVDGTCSVLSASKWDKKKQNGAIVPSTFTLEKNKVSTIWTCCVVGTPTRDPLQWSSDTL